MITGTLEGYSREQAKAALEALGAKVSDSVSKKTTGVIVGESPGSKAAKAEKAGVPILAEADLQALLADESLSEASPRAAPVSRGEDRDEAVLGRARRPRRDRASVLEHREHDRAADQARERAGEVGRARLALHLPAERREAVAQRPAHAGDGERADERAPDRGVGRARLDHADERVGA